MAPASPSVHPGADRGKPGPVLLSPRRSSQPTPRAAHICESPHGLADALIRFEQVNELVEFSASPVTEPLYTVNPFEPIGIAAMFSTHPPIGERVLPCARSTPSGGKSCAPLRSRPPGAAAFNDKNRRRPTLPGGCPPSTIGAGGLNFSVRNGKRCFPAAMTAGNCEVVRTAPSKLHSSFHGVRIKTSGN